MIQGHEREAPLSEEDLLLRARAIEGLTMAQLFHQLNLAWPDNPIQRKGLVGMAVERALGASAGNQAEPDFLSLGIELKTLPLNEHRKPAESTFVTSIPLLTIHQQTWETSSCYAKLKRVLWLPFEADKRISFKDRRVGQAILWSPSVEEAEVLKQDWSEHVLKISMGRYEELTAAQGDYLQVRPKAAHGKSLSYGFDEDGNKKKMLPRGFYLRSRFTERLLK